MSKFNKLFILGLLFGLNLGVNAGEGAGDKVPNVWQLFSEQTLIGKLKLAAALVTLDPRFLPADLYPQEQNSRASSVTLEEPMPSASPTFLSHSRVVSPGPAIVLPVAAPVPVVVPVRRFASLLPKKALNREEREKAAMSGLITRYREGRKAYEPCFDEPGFKRVFGK